MGAKLKLIGLKQLSMVVDMSFVPGKTPESNMDEMLDVDFRYRSPFFYQHEDKNRFQTRACNNIDEGTTGERLTKIFIS